MMFVIPTYKVTVRLKSQPGKDVQAFSLRVPENELEGLLHVLKFNGIDNLNVGLEEEPKPQLGRLGEVGIMPCAEQGPWPEIGPTNTTSVKAS